LEPSPGEAVLIDPVAIASAVSDNLRRVGWPGISLMSQDFQLSLVDKDDAFVEKEVENWFLVHREAVCDELLDRLKTYKIDHLSATARVAMEEAIAAYRENQFLSSVRVLMPEFEAFARSVYVGPKLAPSQKEVIENLKDAIMGLPVSGTDAIESFSLHHFIQDGMFASCFGTTDVRALGDIPNRHAELHGLASYGTLKGASTLVCVMSLLLQMMDRMQALLTPPPILPT
jgi:hypothetical protein